MVSCSQLQNYITDCYNSFTCFDQLFSFADAKAQKSIEFTSKWPYSLLLFSPFNFFTAPGNWLDWSEQVLADAYQSLNEN